MPTSAQPLTQITPEIIAYVCQRIVEAIHPVKITRTAAPGRVRRGGA